MGADSPVQQLIHPEDAPYPGQPTSWGCWFLPGAGTHLCAAKQAAMLPFSEEDTIYTPGLRRQWNTILQSMGKDF